MASFLALVSFICTIYGSFAFVLDGTIFRSQRHCLRSSNNLDYEYIPPRNAEEGRSLQNQKQPLLSLPSSYPAGTPAGLRGEAVRSAIRSRCIGWNFSTDSPLKYGVVEVIGASNEGPSQSMESLTRFLNGKLTRQFAANDVPSFKEASFLNAKGRLVDRIGVAMPSLSSTTTAAAYLLTSPGHCSQDLYQVLDKFVFPFDQIQLRHSSDCVVFSLLSSKQKSIQECFDNYILQRLRDDGSLLSQSQYGLPAIDQCLQIPLVGTSLIIMPTAGLPPCAGWGYTFCFWPYQDQISGENNVGARLWRYLISEECAEGPIEVGALEYETLRIECGQPAYNMEMTANAYRLETKEVSDTEESDSSTAAATPASPLELSLQGTIDLDKGCYQGQEGIASILKNKRGPPRSLYQVVFPDETNIYDYQSEGEYSSRPSPENLTRMPKPNDALYALGSNEEIMVGRITSVAEPSGTGEPVTLALALVRRADSILSSMRQMGIEIPFNDMTVGQSTDASVLIPPPPLDPLDGLEVIIGGTYTMGTLRILPSRRVGSRKNLFSDDDIPMFVQNLPSDEEMNDLVPLTRLNDDRRASSTREPIAVQDAVIVESAKNDDDTLDDEAKILNQAIAEAEEAAREAQRKAEKLEMLRRRAEEAMERRKQKKT